MAPSSFDSPKRLCFATKLCIPLFASILQILTRGVYQIYNCSAAPACHKARAGRAVRMARQHVTHSTITAWAELEGVPGVSAGGYGYYWNADLSVIPAAQCFENVLIT